MRDEIPHVNGPRRVGRTATCSLDQGASICADGRWQGTLGDVADEAKPAFVQGANQVLIAATVAKRTPCGADAGVERRLRDDAAVPDRVEQFVLTDDPVTVSNEVDEQIEYLRLGMNDRARAPQLAPRDVDLEIGETEVQAVARSWSNSQLTAERRTVK